MYRVIIADDVEEFAEWLESLLQASQDFQVIGKVTSGREALRLAELTRPDVVITDVDMPDLDGLDVARLVRFRWPEAKVVLVSAHTDLDYEHLAKEHGALAFIPKKALSPNTLLRTLREGAEL